jgi:hypothetical protein
MPKPVFPLLSMVRRLVMRTSGPQTFIKESYNICSVSESVLQGGVIRWLLIHQNCMENQALD